MSKDQVVLLVSRAIAVIQCITAVLEISYLPERLMSLHHYQARANSLAAISDYPTNLYNTEVGLLCLRVAMLLLIALVFWHCGPKVRALLLPDGRDHAQPAEASLQG